MPWPVSLVLCAFTAWPLVEAAPLKWKSVLGVNNAAALCTGEVETKTGNICTTSDREQHVVSVQAAYLPRRYCASLRLIGADVGLHT
jgi:hypothetical protein